MPVGAYMYEDVTHSLSEPRRSSEFTIIMKEPPKEPQIELSEKEDSAKEPAAKSSKTKKKIAFDRVNDIEFDLQLRGYKKEQVDDYVEALAKDYNAICERIAEVELENKGLRRILTALSPQRGARADDTKNDK